MKRSTILGLALAIVASLFVALPAFAWHGAVQVNVTCKGWEVVVTDDYSPSTSTWVHTPSKSGNWSSGKVVKGNSHVSWSDSNEEYDYPWTAEKPDGCHTPPPKVYRPKAAIPGPCGDPMYRVVFNNKHSNRAVKFVWRYVGDHGVVKLTVVVPAGAVYRSGWRHVIGNTTMWVQSVTTHERLLTQRSDPPGNYSTCYSGFKRGITYYR